MSGWLIVGVMIGFAVGKLTHILHLNIIANKANSPNNIEFIFGKPYAILSEPEYINLLIEMRRKLIKETGEEWTP